MYHIMFKEQKKRTAFERHNWLVEAGGQGPGAGLSCGSERVFPVLEGIKGSMYSRQEQDSREETLVSPP